MPRFQENKVLLLRHKGAIVVNLRSTGNFDTLPGKITIFQALPASTTERKLVEFQKFYLSIF